MSRELRDGREDGLTPLVPLDVEGDLSVSELIERMGRTAFGGRRLGDALEVLRAMVEDPECKVVLTLSGAMTVAKMGRLICTMIEHGMVDYIVSTGALMTHGLTESLGSVHYRWDRSMDDDELYKKGYNRVYDTLEMEANLFKDQDFIDETLDRWPPETTMSSFAFCRELGKLLAEKEMLPSVLGTAYQKGVPIYIPAFTDSEMALDVASYYITKQGAPSDDPDAFLAPVPDFNPFLDLHDITRRFIDAERLGIFTIGGGVPRNWAQQVACYIEFMNDRHELEFEIPRIQYAVRICPEPTHLGGLSGCTYSEGKSWGKFLPESEGGRFAEVYADATIVWPLLVRALLEVRNS